MKPLFKRIIFGDCHGHFDSINKIYQIEQPWSVVHLGDYFDNFSNDVEAIKQSFIDLVNLKNTHESIEGNGPFTMLIGNHDFQYLKYYMNERCSGYNEGYALWAHEKLSEMWDNKQIKIIEIDKHSKTIYSHAGISNTWLKDNRMEGIDLSLINTDINFNALRFTYRGGGDSYGTTIYASPLWIRPEALIKDMYKDEKGNLWTQIVGHTPKHNPTCYYLKNDVIGPIAEDYNFINLAHKKPKLWIIDCMPNFYIREMVTKDGEVKSREMVKSNI